MAAPLTVLLEKLIDDRWEGVADAGAMLLSELSESRLQPAGFLDDPLCLAVPPFSVPKYLIQITQRALCGEYESVEELAASLQGFSNRNPPILEPGRPRPAELVALPEARVLELVQPAQRSDGSWAASIVAAVTSGAMAGREIEIRIDSRQNRRACFAVSFLWTHASFSAYNLIPAGTAGTSEGGNVFDAGPETFLVIEPMRQINVTAIARSLHCTKPQLDQMRSGKGDTTLHTLKGTVVHAIFDRLLEGATGVEALCADVLQKYTVAIASIVDEFFDEAAFRREILRHVTALQLFIEANPKLVEHPQIELKRYSATLGIQGRIDALFRQGNRIDILELKTGARVRQEDHAQLFIYRLLLSDLVRRSQRADGKEVEITARLLSSTDGALSPLQIQTGFQEVMDARNRLLATHYALGRIEPQFKFRYEGFSEDICGACVSWVRTRCRESTRLFGDRPGATGGASLELDYFRRFTRLLERERWLADQEIADLLDDSRIDVRRRNFRALSGVRFVPDAEPFTFEFDENTSDFATGDAVLVHSGSISSSPIYHGFVREMDTRRVCVSIPVKNLAPELFLNQSWIVDRLPSDMTTEASHTALYDFLISPADPRKKTIAEYGFDASEPPARSDSGFRPRVEKMPVLHETSLNDSQRRAVERASSCEVFHLVWGPPGTGKTKVIPEIVARVRGRVLLGAFTNTAVDKMLAALVLADPAVRFLRIGRSSDSPELSRLLKDPSEYFSDDLAARRPGINAVREAMDAAPIVAATAHRACTMPYLRRRAFEMTIVDEAGQLTEPLTLGLVLRSRRFVLVGDDRQLPPVVRTRALARSMFERMKGAAERTRSDDLTLLDVQYRMHPQIMAVSNRLSYEGRLRAGVSEGERLPPDSAPVVLIPVEGGSEGRVNFMEADVVAGLVRHYRQAHGIPASGIGVVSPFRAQVVLLRKQLQSNGWGAGVTVDTVERFQGGERDIMILSLVRSQGGGFVFDQRRFNVAITRARRKLVFVAHPALFRNSRYEWICNYADASPLALLEGFEGKERLD